MQSIRYDASMYAAHEILKAVGLSSTPTHAVLLAKIAFHVLEAIYESEAKLADQPPTRTLCGWCLRSLPIQLGVDAHDQCCPVCSGRMRMPRKVNCN